MGRTLRPGALKSILRAVNVMNFEDAIVAMRERFAEGRGFRMATMNLDHLDQLARSQELRGVYSKHEFVTADGFPIAYANRSLGRAVDVAAGSDLIVPLCVQCAEDRIPVGLIGTSEEALRIAATRLRQLVPMLEIRLACAPSRSFDPYSAEADRILGEIAEQGPILCFIALGTPKGETFAARTKELAPRAGVVSIGAGLDFIAGTAKRAPVSIRRAHLEWLWRWAHEPRRLTGRYLRGIRMTCLLVPIFIFGRTRQAMSAKAGRQ